jgi:hypothetical protein
LRAPPHRRGLLGKRDRLCHNGCNEMLRLAEMSFESVSRCKRKAGRV